jgi:hypothetical protein
VWAERGIVNVKLALYREVNNLYSSPNISQVIKSKKRNAYRILVKIHERKRQFCRKKNNIKN